MSSKLSSLLMVVVSNDGVVVVVVESVAKLSGGDVDVEPFLISRNTLGNGKPRTQILKWQI
jgi:hypothetical protein